MHEDTETDEEDCDQEAFLGSVGGNQSSKAWMRKINLQGVVVVDFKLDAGAEVTAISEATFQQIGYVKLEPPSRALLGPANQTLDVVGHFKGTLSLADKKHTDRIYVVGSLRNNLLGLPSIMGLQLLANTEAISNS